MKFTGLTYKAPQEVAHLYFEESDGTLTQTPGAIALEYREQHQSLKPLYKAILDQRGVILAL